MSSDYVIIMQGDSMKKNGFTIVELLGAIAVLGILMVVATTAVASVMNKQKNKVNAMAGQNLDDAAISYFVGKKKVYMPPCKSASGATPSGVNFSQSDVDLFNKNYGNSFNENNTSTNRTNFLNGAHKTVSDTACLNFVTVGTLIDQGLLDDSSGACNKKSVVLVYKQYTYEAGDEYSEEVAVHQTGVCG